MIKIYSNKEEENAKESQITEISKIINNENILQYKITENQNINKFETIVENSKINTIKSIECIYEEYTIKPIQYIEKYNCEGEKYIQKLNKCEKLFNHDYENLNMLNIDQSKFNKQKSFNIFKHFNKHIYLDMNHVCESFNNTNLKLNKKNKKYEKLEKLQEEFKNLVEIPYEISNFSTKKNNLRKNITTNNDLVNLNINQQSLNMLEKILFINDTNNINDNNEFIIKNINIEKKSFFLNNTICDISRSINLTQEDNLIQIQNNDEIFKKKHKNYFYQNIENNFNEDSHFLKFIEPNLYMINNDIIILKTKLNNNKYYGIIYKLCQNEINIKIINNQFSKNKILFQEHAKNLKNNEILLLNLLKNNFILFYKIGCFNFTNKFSEKMIEYIIEYSKFIQYLELEGFINYKNIFKKINTLISYNFQNFSLYLLSNNMNYIVRKKTFISRNYKKSYEKYFYNFIDENDNFIDLSYLIFNLTIEEFNYIIQNILISNLNNSIKDNIIYDFEILCKTQIYLNLIINNDYLYLEKNIFVYDYDYQLIKNNSVFKFLNITENNKILGLNIKINKKNFKKDENTKIDFFKKEYFFKSFNKENLILDITSPQNIIKIKNIIDKPDNQSIFVIIHPLSTSFGLKYTFKNYYSNQINYDQYKKYFSLFKKINTFFNKIKNINFLINNNNKSLIIFLIASIGIKNNYFSNKIIKQKAIIQAISFFNLDNFAEEKIINCNMQNDSIFNIFLNDNIFYSLKKSNYLNKIQNIYLKNKI